MADDEKILGIKKSELTELVRQILAEMPTSLPANGGNADYATNAGTLSQWGRAPTLNLDNVDLGFIAASGEANSAPNTFWSTVLTVGQGVQSYAAQLAFPWLYDPSQAMKYRMLSNGVWSDWKEISTNPVKSVQVVGTTDWLGNFVLWNSSENRKPVFITFADHYVIPFLSSNGNYYAHVLSAATDEQLTGTAVTATVFYIEI